MPVMPVRQLSRVSDNVNPSSKVEFTESLPPPHLVELIDFLSHSVEL